MTHSGGGEKDGVQEAKTKDVRIKLNEKRVTVLGREAEKEKVKRRKQKTLKKREQNTVKR